MLKLDVEGMTCDHCAHAVTNAVESVAPGAKVTVDLKSGTVTVASGEGVSTEQLVAAIGEEGYTVRHAATA